MKNIFLRSLLFSVMIAFALTSCRNEDNKIEPTCFDEVQNQGELGIDCGGPCPECEPTCDNLVLDQRPEFDHVEINIDCGGPCAPCATCDDNIQNAHWIYDPNLTMEDFGSDSVGMANGLLFRLILEQGIDCGYPCQEFCDPTCEDGIQNGDEEGIDCGGSCEFPCPPPSCADGIQNGQETGIDCGAPGCPDCPMPTCDDGIQNVHIEYVEETPQNPLGYLIVDEQGVDCDNDFETSCPDCPIPTCFDGILNQGETAIDCGGPCPNECPPTPNCGNGVQDGNETGVDCDDDPDTPCPPCATCTDMIQNGPELEIDCVDYPIPQYDGGNCPLCISCHDGEQNQCELDVDCGGPNCEPCEQFITADGLGSGANPSSFSDQQTMNELLAMAEQDTISITTTISGATGADALYVERVSSFTAGIDYLKATAVQEFETPDEFRYRRTLTLYLPMPEEIGEMTAVPLIPIAPISEFNGTINEFDIEEVPFVFYKEELVGNPNFVTKNFSSINGVAPLANLTYTYIYNEITCGFYVKGSIDDVEIVAPIFNPGGDDEAVIGTANGIEFQFNYQPF